MHKGWRRQQQQQLESDSRKMKAKAASGKTLLALCIACFLAGSFFSTWTHTFHQDNNQQIPINFPNHVTKLADEVTSDCDHHDNKPLVVHNYRDIVGNCMSVCVSLDKTISALEMELAVARTSHNDGQTSLGIASNHSLQRAFVVVGINTAFSSKKRRDSVRSSWMPTGEELRRMEKEKGIVIRFVIGHSATRGGVLDKAIDAEDAEHQDFLRLNHVEGYHQLSTKTRLYFSTAISIWDADFYVKVDDDVHVNLGMLVNTLANHKSKPRIYIGCMKSGPVLSQKPILHRYANEDVSLGSWFIGLEVEHVDDRSMCCGTPPDCEWKAKAGNACVASFDWSCSGICKSVERMKIVHNSCGEGDDTVWNVDF
ncbi:putative beta-1,3-galactosyltransferase 8 [Citrus sinensis]|nr:putative beta-1,3-galactosyltransferase 8 [Citrus sinensis]